MRLASTHYRVDYSSGYYSEYLLKKKNVHDIIYSTGLTTTSAQFIEFDQTHRLTRCARSYILVS